MAKNKKNKLDPDGGDRKFVMLIYEDSETYDWHEVLARVMEYSDQWAYIRHDKDIDSVQRDGVEVQEIKKPHYHVCMRFKTPRIRQTVANNLGIEKNYIQRAVKGWKAVNRYLIHLDDDDKYQYPWYDVCTNFSFYELVDKKETEVGKVNELIDFILRENCTSVVQLGNYAREHDLWDAYRRNYTILKDYMWELSQVEKKKQQIEYEKQMRLALQDKRLRKDNLL